MPRQKISWCDNSSPLRASPGGMPGRREGRSRGNPYVRVTRFMERSRSCKGRFGEPCKGTAKEVSPPQHLFAGESLGGGDLGRPLPRGYGDAAAPRGSREAQPCPRTGRETMARALQTREREMGQAAGAAAMCKVPIQPPQVSRHDPESQDPGTTRAQPLRCPRSPAPSATPSQPCQAPTGRGGLAPSPGGALPSSGSPKINPHFPKRQILAPDPG